MTSFQKLQQSLKNLENTSVNLNNNQINRTKSFMPKILEQQSNKNTLNEKTTSVNNNDEQRKVRFMIGNEVMDHTDQSEASGMSDSENINYLNTLGENQSCEAELGAKAYKHT